MSNLSAKLRSTFSQSHKQALRNPWALSWFGLIIVVMGVNIAFIAVAIATNPGLVTTDYYDRGRDYEKNMRKKIAAREALGWRIAIEQPHRAQAGTPALFRLNATDRQGAPLRDAAVEVTAYRPSDADADFSTVLEPGGHGRYQGTINFPLKGVWDLTFMVRRGQDSYAETRRVSVLAP